MRPNAASAISQNEAARGHPKKDGVDTPVASSLRYTVEYERLLDQYEGQPIEVSFRQLVGPLPADELTHSIYPYPARLLRQIPRMLLGVAQLTRDVDYVLDPFCGSGTILLESQNRHIPSVGFEQNPIAALITRVKTTRVQITALEDMVRQTILTAKHTRKVFDRPTYLTKWYNEESLSVLGRLSIQQAALPVGPEADVVRLAIALLARELSFADRRISVPVRDPGRTVAQTSHADAWYVFNNIIAKVLDRVSKLTGNRASAECKFGDSRNAAMWHSLPENRSALLVTSPPYGAAQKYARSVSLEAGWLGYSSMTGTIEMERDSIGREHLSQPDQRRSIGEIKNKKIQNVLYAIKEQDKTRGKIYTNYFLDLEAVFDNVSESGSKVARVVMVSAQNSVGSMQVNTPEHIGDILQERGFSRKLALRDPIKGRTLLTARKTKGKPAPAEFIEVFER